MAATHGSDAEVKSEPEHFIEFAERVPEWCVVVGLIGAGQEIHVGEEAGIGQWRDAIERSPNGTAWTIHMPPHLEPAFDGVSRRRVDRRLHLTAELRYHLAEDVHKFVEGLLEELADQSPGAIAEGLERNGFHLRITRDLAQAKSYLWNRYEGDQLARFGIVASSRDVALWQFGVPNDFQSTNRIRYGPWFGEGDEDPEGRSCRTLRTCVTEFGCQGLELDSCAPRLGYRLHSRGWQLDSTDSRSATNERRLSETRCSSDETLIESF